MTLAVIIAGRSSCRIAFDDSGRLLSAPLLLQAYGRLSGRVLADRLEVSARTVHRDMDALSAAGVPVFATRGAQGGWQLDDGWRARVPALDESELRGLLMAQPRVAGDPRLAASAERALTKLLAALPPTLREHAATLGQRLHVDTTGWRGAAEDLSPLPLVQDAVTRDRMLSIRYRQAGQAPATRKVHPLGLVAKGLRRGTSSRTRHAGSAPIECRGWNGWSSSTSRANDPQGSIPPPVGKRPRVGFASGLNTKPHCASSPAQRRRSRPGVSWSASVPKNLRPMAG